MDLSADFHYALTVVTRLKLVLEPANQQPLYPRAIILRVGNVTGASIPQHVLDQGFIQGLRRYHDDGAKLLPLPLIPGSTLKGVFRHSVEAYMLEWLKGSAGDSYKRYADACVKCMEYYYWPQTGGGGPGKSSNLSSYFNKWCLSLSPAPAFCGILDYLFGRAPLGRGKNKESSSPRYTFFADGVMGHLVFSDLVPCSSKDICGIVEQWRTAARGNSRLWREYSVCLRRLCGTVTIYGLHEARSEGGLSLEIPEWLLEEKEFQGQNIRVPVGECMACLYGLLSYTLERFSTEGVRVGAGKTVRDSRLRLNLREGKVVFMDTLKDREVTVSLGEYIEALRRAADRILGEGRS